MLKMNANMLEEVFTEAGIHFDLLEQIPANLTVFPEGWLTLTEIQILYFLAKNVSGPILEIGSWLGRSTIAIAAGVRDNTVKPPFDTVDLGLTSAEEWRTRLGSEFVYNDTIVRTVYAPGGSIGALIENLRKATVLEWVTSVIRGEVTQVPLRAEYSLLFCDTLHDQREIDAYGSFIDHHLAPGGWLVCDDILDDSTGDLLRRWIQLDFLLYTSGADRYSKFAVGRKRGRPSGDVKL